MKPTRSNSRAPLAFAATTAAIVAIVAAAGPREDDTPFSVIEVVDGMTTFPGSLAPLPAAPTSARSRQTDETVALGKKLFFDPSLSRDGITSCATCHSPDHAYADARPRATGSDGRPLARNTPTILNAAYNTTQFWDGRAASLEDQVRAPLLAAREMNMADEATVMRAVLASKETTARFRAAFGDEPTFEHLCQSLADFERTLVTPSTPYDRYMRGDKHALNDAQKRGLFLFIGKASCSQCHNGPTLSDQLFHNLGLTTPTGTPPDEGRFAITSLEADRGAFRTPPLRNIAATGPYMHDGSLASLKELIEFYDRGGGEGRGKSTLLRPLDLSPEDKSDLLAFLRSLTGEVPDKSPSASPAQVIASPTNEDGK